MICFFWYDLVYNQTEFMLDPFEDRTNVYLSPLNVQLSIQFLVSAPEHR
jgi:hypothetical protein